MAARRLLRPLIWAALALTVLAAVAVTFARSTLALEWAAAQLSASVRAAGGQLVFEGLSGSLLGTLRAQRIEYSSAGTSATLDEVEIVPSLPALWRREIVIHRLAVARLDLQTTASGEPLSEPQSLALPIEVRIDQARLGRLRWRSGDTEVELGGISFGFSGGPERLSIEALSLTLPMAPMASAAGAGAVTLALTGSIAASAPFVLSGRARASAPEFGVAEVALAGRLAKIEIAGSVAGSAAYAALTATVGATVAPFLPAWLPAATVETRGVDLAVWVPGAPKTALDLRVEASAAQGRPITGRMRANNLLAGELGVNRLPVTALDSRFEIDPGARQARFPELRIGLSGNAEVTGRGRVWVPVAAPGARAAPPGAKAAPPGDRTAPPGDRTAPPGRRAPPPRAGAAPDSEWTLEVSGLDLKALDARLVPTRLTGRVALALSAIRQRFDLALDQRDMRVEALGEHALGEVKLERLLLRAGAVADTGEAGGRARLRLDGDREFEADLQLRAFDPARFAALSAVAAPDVPPASISGRLQLRGKLQPTWQARVELDLAPSRIVIDTPPLARTLSLQGRVRGLFSAGRVDEADIALAAGRNALTARGSLGVSGSALEVVFDGNQLASLLPGLEGQLNLAASVRGTLSAPTGSFSLKGAALRWDGSSLAQITARGQLGQAVPRTPIDPAAAARSPRMPSKSATATVPAPGPAKPSPSAAALLADAYLDAEFDARTLAISGARLAQAGGKLTGTLARHLLSLSARAPDVDARVVLEGGLLPGLAPRVEPGRGPKVTARPEPAVGAKTLAQPPGRGMHWKGRVLEARNLGRFPASLVAPTWLELAADTVMLGPAQVVFGEGRLQVDELRWQAGRLATRGSLAGYPAGDLIALALPAPPGSDAPEFDSTLRVGGQWAVTATPRLNGTVTLRRESGDLSVRAAPAFALGLTRTDVDIRFVDDRLEAKARLEGSALGAASAALTLLPAPRLSLASPMTLRADLSVRTLKPFARYLGALVDIEGTVAASVEGTGTPAKPELSGALRGDQLRVDAPQFGLSLRGGRVDLRLASGVIDVVSLEARAGQGMFTAKGSLPLRPGTQVSAPLTWRAERFSLLSRPDRRVVLDGEGTLAFERSRLLLDGRLRAREGYFEFATRARSQLGDDVVVLGRKPAVSARPGGARSPLGLRLEFDFGDNFRVVGNGLDAFLTGRLLLASTDDGTLTARGKISTTRGTYSAFGQRLEIDRGSVVFNGPLDNPGLDIVALRRVTGVEAGVELSGTLRAPRVRITSNPPMSQGEQLSWLVLGRSLDRASQGDLALIAGIAASLLGGQGAENGVPITRRIANTFGLDEIGLRGNGALADQALTVGKRFSDRVYIAFEQAVSTTGSLLRLELALTSFVSVRAEAGSVSSFGIFYTRSLR